VESRSFIYGIIIAYISSWNKFLKKEAVTNMKRTSINERRKKGSKLNLNKQTIVHLDYRQMSLIGGDNSNNESNLVGCTTETTCPTVERGCLTITTRDTGIPPEGLGDTLG
jgi:hypothetical protein